MNENINNLTKIEKFLQGQFSAEESEGLLRTLQTDPGLQHQLYEESSFEAAFYSQQWLESATSVKEDIGDWFAAVAPLSAIEKEQAAGTGGSSIDEQLTHDKWQGIIDKAFDRAQKSEVKPAFILPFFTMNIKSAATIFSLILIVGILAFFNLRNTTTPQRVSDTTLTTDTHQDKDRDDYAADNELDNMKESEAISAFDMINEFSAPEIDQSKIKLPSRKKSVVYLSKNSGFLAERNANITIISNNDSVVTLSMNKGRAVFEVEKNRYKRFVVITPHVEVRVVGTIFRVAVTKRKSDVTVIEGKVTVTTMKGTQEELTLTRGKTAYVSEEMLVRDIIERSKMLQLRENLLRSYLQYMQKSHLDRFTIDSILNMLQKKEKRLLDSLVNTSDPVISAQLMHYRVAHNHEKSHLYEKAAEHFLQVYKERQNETVAQLALVRACLLSIENLPLKRALKYFETYIDDFTNGFALKEITILYIRTCLAERDFDKVIPHMAQFVKQFPESAYADHIAFNLAQLFRQQTEDLASAMNYYEFVIEHFPESPYREDAMYWAGWCVVQKQLHKHDNKFFKEYLKNYPDGNWRGIITER
ncbi:FecR domain-containing protein [Fibrobacterota bacterium]